MPSLSAEEVLDQINDDNRNENTLSGPIIGIIYPPPEVRSILNLKTQWQTLKRLAINFDFYFFLLNKHICLLDNSFKIETLKYIFLNRLKKISLIKLLASLPEMDPSSRLESDKMSWAIQSLIS